MNLVPSQYRNVSVADVPVALDEESLRGYLLGRVVYRRTRYLVAHHGGASAVVEVSKESEGPLFSPVTAVTVIARPDETAVVDAPDTDTGVPTQLARVAAQHAPGARCVIVHGRYGHVSFILDQLAVINRGAAVVVANSNRMDSPQADHQELTVLDASKLTAGSSAVLGWVPAGAFPRATTKCSADRTT